MGEEEPGDDLNSPKGNSMTLSTGLKREVMVPPFFILSSAVPGGPGPDRGRGWQECRRDTIWAENCSVSIYWERGRKGDL
jgi:hypothetical protein